MLNRSNKFGFGHNQLYANQLMKNLILTIISVLIVFTSCKKTVTTSNTTSVAKIPKLILEKSGWHVLGGQIIPLTVGATAVQVQFENGHFSQTYKTMFYADANTTNFEYARCNINGDSVFIRRQETPVEYNPFFYEEGDKSDVRYGAYFPPQSTYGASSHNTIGLYGIGPAAVDVNTKLFDFPPNIGGYPSSPGKFANPYWFVYWDVSKGGYFAYRVGTAQTIDMAGFYENNYVILNGAGGLQIDENWGKANPAHVRCYFASTNNNVSILGHSRNYISFYTADDVNRTAFRDSTSDYIAGGNILSCADATNIYYLINKSTVKTDVSLKNTKLLMLVFDKTTLKLTKKMLWKQDFDVIEDLVMIPNKNQLFLKSNLGTSGLFRLDLADYSITNITPQLAGDNGNSIASLAITTDGNKLFATVGSLYAKYQPAVTNVIYYE